MLDLGMQELIVIFVVALLVFGPKKLPELGRTLGKGMRELKMALRGVQESVEEIEKDASEEITEAKKDMEELITKELSPETDTEEKKEKPEGDKDAR